MSAEPAPRPAGEVFDRGYRHYDGRREGRAHAIRALIVYSLKRGVGIKKRWTAKIIPILLYVAAFLPVIVIIGIRALAGRLGANFGYPNLYSALSTIMLIFAAATAPEMLADDRRQQVLPLYFSRPISRGDYLLAKVAALGLLMSTISLLPALLLYAGDVLLADSPLGYLGDHIGTLLRILVAGTLIALFYAAIALLVATLTDRKAVAAAVTIGAVFVVSGVAVALFTAVTGGLQPYIALLDLISVPQGIAGWVLQYRPSTGLAGRSTLGGAWYLVDVLTLTGISAWVMQRRYLHHG